MKWVGIGWLVAVVVVLALGVPGRFTDAEKNDRTSFLPAGAESTKAIEAQRATGDERTPIVLVYQRDGGLRQPDVARAIGDITRLRAAQREHPEIYRGIVADTDQVHPLLQGEGMLLRVNAHTPANTEGLNAVVRDMRARFSGDHDGLRVRVTGPAAFVADTEDVFDTVDTRVYLVAVLLVVALLALIYRSPLLIWLPLIAVGCAELMTQALGYLVAQAGATITDQASSIASVLVLGVGTDYALLLIARYRERLRAEADHRQALATARRAVAPAVIASGLTVAAALMCLTLAGVRATRGLGPLGALGVLVTVAAMLTLLPALLSVAGRRVFWRPALLGRGDGIPRPGDDGSDAVHGAWHRLGERVARRPRPVWIAAVAVLAALCLAVTSMNTGLTQAQAFRHAVESVQGQALVAKLFGPSAAAPTVVYIPTARAAALPAIDTALRAVHGVAQVTPGEDYGGGQTLEVELSDDPYSRAAYAVIPQVREVAHRTGGAGVLVGGATATEADLRSAAAGDNRVIVPATLLVVALILVVLLRAFTGPLVLVATILLSFGAALGLSLLVFEHIFGFPGVDPALPLYAFVFLVAIGADYTIFLMTRVREEALEHGTRDGVVRGLAVTGGVITSAGIVLAGTFAVLAALPLVSLTEIGFVIAAGILLDTFVIRSVLVPALVADLGARTWWPSRGIAD